LTEVVSIRFKNRGKCYFFAPNGLKISTGDKVIVETSKGLEIADVSRGVHSVADTAVVQPLRPVARIATADDLRVAEVNKRREKEAMEICAKKIVEHGLDMKLVDVECNFDGSKTTFYFTSDGRVDFRELVKDLAGVFRNRIELRQIGARDEAKMLGGIGLCGRPYCCSQFLEELQPVSTKMAKVQSLSLNPTKISGSCGKLMCCLRYEQEAYEELVKKVPKQGAFVETKDGYGTAMQVNLLRQTVKVKLDNSTDDTLQLFKANELCTVPGGRPKDGETPPSVLHYVPEEEEPAEEAEDSWTVPAMYAEEAPSSEAESAQEEKPEAEAVHERRHSRNNRRRRQKSDPTEQGRPVQPRPEQKKQQGEKKPAAKPEQQGESKGKPQNRGKATVKPVKVEQKQPKPNAEKPAAEAQSAKPAGEGKANKPHRGRYRNHRKPRPAGEGKPKE